MLSSGHRKSFHVPRNVNIPSVTKIGIASGKNYFSVNLEIAAPSILAASIRLSGIDRQCCLIKNIPKMFAIPVTIIAIYVLIKPTDLSIRNNGSIVIWLGTIILIKSRLKSLVFPLNLYFANAYPAIELKKREMKVTTTERKKLLKKVLCNIQSCKESLILIQNNFIR